jgi:hypothetical protein
MMITIDLKEEFVSQPEKPLNRITPTYYTVDICRYDPVYSVIRKQHQDLLRASHNARMLKNKDKEGLAVEVQRYLEKMRVEVFTLAERYAGRAG